MVTIDLSAAPPAPTAGGLGGLPRRLSLTLPELRFVAERAGGAPLPFAVPGATDTEPLGDRLGRSPTAIDTEAYAAALTGLRDPGSSLARRGLLVDTSLDETLLGAVGLLATPALAVDVDVAAGGVRARAWHRQRGDAVATLATTDGLVFELAWFPVDHWAGELARLAVPPEGVVPRPSGVPAYLDLPHTLADAAGEAVRSLRADLLSVLVAEHTGATRDADGRTVPDLEVVTLLGTLARETRGRLRVLVADATAASVVGVVAWVLLADGWRALRPRRVDGADRVVVARVGPGDLAVELTPVLAEVRG